MASETVQNTNSSTIRKRDARWHHGRRFGTEEKGRRNGEGVCERMLGILGNGCFLRISHCPADANPHSPPSVKDAGGLVSGWVPSTVLSVCFSN